MKVKNVFKIIILVSIMIVMFNSKCLAVSTKKMEITGGEIWNYVTVSESYDICEALNSQDSTLGTDKLQAHLSTDADWSIMAIFSASQYGGAIANIQSITNGNRSGIYGIDGKNNMHFQTTGIYENISTANNNFSALYTKNVDGTITAKKYVTLYRINQSENDNVWFRKVEENGTFGFKNSLTMYGNDPSYGGSIKYGLFGVAIFVNNNNGSPVGLTGGGRFQNASFRPVIWN